ncbi:MAG: hypothetical protein WCJ30_07965 [Deltaproteobacteria bacterium]
MDAPDDPLLSAREKLDDTLASLHGAANDPAMIMAARNAIVSLGGMVRFGSPAGEMAQAVARTAEAVRRQLVRDPGDTLAFPLLDSRAAALAAVVQQHGDLERLDPEDRHSWVEEAYEIFAARDAADAWLLGAAALLRCIEPGEERTYLERAREGAVAAITRFDRALEPALGGLSPLREDAKKAVVRAKADKGYMRRAYYWVKIIEG